MTRSSGALAATGRSSSMLPGLWGDLALFHSSTMPRRYLAANSAAAKSAELAGICNR